MTLQELAQQYDVSPGQISQRKKQLAECAGELFARSDMIELGHPLLTISKQCELLDINRAVYYYERRESRSEADLEDLKRILEVLQEMPF